MKKILILTASCGENKKLASEIDTQLKSLGVQTTIAELTAYNLPLYTGAELTDLQKKSVDDIANQLNQADGLFVVVPEYNGSIPPVLSNTICWVSQAGGDDWRELFNEKIIAFATHSGGNGVNVLRSLSLMFEHLGMTVVGRKILTTYQKPLNNESLVAVTSQLVRLSQKSSL